MKQRVRRQNVFEYSAFFERNEDGGYTVVVPSLPGLVTEGQNLEEAKRMAEDAIGCYLVGLRKQRQHIPMERESAMMRLAVSA